MTDLSDFNLLNLTGEFREEKDKKTKQIIYKFGAYSTDERLICNEIYKVFDPSSDQAFKILFNGKYKLKNVDGFGRAKSLINSLLDKFPDNSSIQNIEYWPNEIVKLTGKNREGLKVMDCPLLCTMTNNKQYLIDLEIQNYYFNGIDLNALSCGNALRNASDIPVIILLLLFKQSEYNNSFEIIPFKKYLNEGEFKKIDDFVYVICFDLYYILGCIQNKEEPELNGFHLSEEGKKWIKLITIKEWMKKLKGTDRYPIPKEIMESDELISSIMLLNSSDNSDLVKSVQKEKEKKIYEEMIENKKVIEIWIYAFLKNKDVDNEIVTFPKVAPEFLIKICKRILTKINCKFFIRMLINKKIIPSHNIYEELISSLYKN